jgi:hypothetical protein
MGEWLVRTVETIPNYKILNRFSLELFEMFLYFGEVRNGQNIVSSDPE